MQRNSPPEFRPATHGQVLAFLVRYAKRYVWPLVFMTVMLVISQALHLAQPFFYRALIDAIAETTPGNRYILGYGIRMAAYGVLFGAASIALFEISARILGWIESRIMHRVHADVFARVQRLSTRFHVNAFAGATARKIGRGTNAVEGIFDVFWFNFLPLALLVIGFMIALSYVAPILGIAFLIGMGIYIPAAIFLNVKLAKYHSWTDRQDTRVTGSLVDAVTGNPAVKSFGAEEREESRHEGVLGEWQHRLLTSWWLGNLISHFQSMLLVLLELVILVLSVWLWYRGEFSAGSFIIVFSYLGRLWAFMRDIGRQVRNYLRNMAHAEEMVGLYRVPLEVADAPDAQPLHVTDGAITFEHVSFAYPEHRSSPAKDSGQFRRAGVFADFSLTIEGGEKIALVGHSGGGKTTFVKLLQRLYDTDGGRILIDGQDIARVTQESLRRSIALVPQEPILFHRSIAENIAYAKPGATREEVEHVAKHAHAHEFIRGLPDGYDTLVGERGVKLSGGERQRVAIARALLADAPILILDEATSSLDSQSEGYIQQALVELMEGRTTIAIAHRLSTIKRMDRIVVFEDGRIAEEGTHADLANRDGGIYRHFFELQAGGFLGEE